MDVTMGGWMQRELDPATPPWLTVRWWLTITALAASITALVLSL